MTVSNLIDALLLMPGDANVIVEAECFDDPHYVGVADASRVVLENRGDGEQVYVTSVPA